MGSLRKRLIHQLLWEGGLVVRIIA